MSTLMAPGVVLDGPLPRSPEYALMSVAEDVSAQSPASRGGANVVPYPDGRAEDIISATDPCDIGSDTKLTPDALTIPELFPAFDAYLGEICTAYSIGDWDEWRGRADRAFLARENWMLERQLVGATFATAPSLASVAVANSTILNSGNAVAARTAVALLEAFLAEFGTQGVLHLTPPVVSYLGFENFETRGGQLRTAAGTPAIAGAGYHGADEPAGEEAAGEGRSWIYASGVPQYAREGQVFSLPEDIREALDRDDNTVIYRAERGLWVGWDGQFSAAVLADWSP